MRNFMEVTQDPAAGLNDSSDPCKIPQALEANLALLYNINIPTVKSKNYWLQMQTPFLEVFQH